ncbi:MAG: SCO1664 family protein [Chloroflexi bacterium]|nr:SCO1664 family protein [Chloroflexota bacterium]
MAQRTKASSATLSLLRGGEVTNPRAIPAGHNAAFLVDVRQGDAACKAVYKPRDGERPLWDFPYGTLYRREYLAWRVSEALGWEIVPATAIREGPYGIGSLQLFIEAVPEAHYFTIQEQRRADLTPIAVFDCLINNTDRKGGHILQAKGDGRLWGIDHGLSFHAEPKLRTVMWELDKAPLPASLVPAIATLCHDEALTKEITSHLAPGEVTAFYQRVEALAAARAISFKPFADRRRPYPWPPL